MDKVIFWCGTDIGLRLEGEMGGNTYQNLETERAGRTPGGNSAEGAENKVTSPQSPPFHPLLLYSLPECSPWPEPHWEPRAKKLPDAVLGGLPRRAQGEQVWNVAWESK